MMEHPGPYIPSAQNRIGTRIEWLAAVALFETRQAADAARPRVTLGPWTWPAPSREWMQTRKDYERLRNAEARELCDGMANSNPRERYEGLRNTSLAEQQARGIGGYAASRGAWHVESGSDAWAQLFGPRPYWP